MFDWVYVGALLNAMDCDLHARSNHHTRERDPNAWRDRDMRAAGRRDLDSLAEACREWPHFETVDVDSERIVASNRRRLADLAFYPKAFRAVIGELQLTVIDLRYVWRRRAHTEAAAREAKTLLAKLSDLHIALEWTAELADLLPGHSSYRSRHPEIRW